MNPRSTGLLLLVAMALGAFVYLYEVRGGAQRKDAEQTEKRLFPGLAATDVSSIDLTTTDGRTARVERKDGAWQVVEPITFPGDAVNLDGMAAGLADLSSNQVIESPQAPEIYGLDATSRVTRFGAGGKEYALRVGKRVPVGSDSYAATGEAPNRIVTVPTFKATNLERSLDDLRDRRILNFDRASIASAVVRWPSGEVRVARGDGGWRLVSPVEGAADDAAVDTLLSNLSYLRAESFEDQPGPAAKTGLDRPALEVILSPKPSPGQTVPDFRLAFGKEENGKRLVQAGQTALYRVPAERLDELPRTVTAYRFKEVSRYVATDAKSVELVFHERGALPLTELLVHGETGWTGAPEAIDPGKAARLVAELARLRGAEIVAESASEAELVERGLSPPRVRIRVLAGADGAAPAAELAVVEIGEDPDGKGPFARTPMSPVIYRLGATVQEWLPTGLTGFRSTFAAPAAPPSPDPGDGTSEAPSTSPEPPALPNG